MTKPSKLFELAQETYKCIDNIFTLDQASHQFEQENPILNYEVEDWLKPAPKNKDLFSGK